MAKRNNDNDGRSDKGKIRLLFVEVDGNNESIKEALKTMVATMNKSAQSFPTAPRGDQPPAITADSFVDDADPGSLKQSEDETTESTAPAPRKRGDGPKVDRNSGIALVPDLDFRPDGGLSLRDFVAGKQPKNDMEHIVVLVYYLERIMGISSIGPGHVRTAFKDINVPLPIDLKGTIRNLRRDKAWLKFTDITEIRIATAGENLVEHDLPAKKA